MKQWVLVICVGILCTALFPGLAIAQGPYRVMDWARSQFRRELVVETAGLFWIAAEAAILLGMTLAVRILRERPLPDTLRLTIREKRYAWSGLLALLLLATVVYGRHILLVPLPRVLTTIGETGTDIVGRAESAYYLRAHTHIALWCGFIVVWMALEVAIVAQGIRTFYTLRRRVLEARRAT